MPQPRANPTPKSGVGASRRIRRPWRIPFVAQAGYLMLLAALCTGAYFYADHRDLRGLYEDYLAGEQELLVHREALEEEQSRAAALEEHVAGLNTNPVEREAAARRNKNLVRSGERIYRFQIVDPPDPLDEREADTRNPAK